MQRADRGRCAPRSQVQTPNIDKLLSAGVKLDRFYVHKFCRCCTKPSSVCGCRCCSSTVSLVPPPSRLILCLYQLSPICACAHDCSPICACANYLQSVPAPILSDLCPCQFLRLPRKSDAVRHPDRPGAGPRQRHQRRARSTQPGRSGRRLRRYTANPAAHPLLRCFVSCEPRCWWRALPSLLAAIALEYTQRLSSNWRWRQGSRGI